MNELIKGNNYVFIVFSSLLFISIVVELVLAFMEKERLRKIFKIFPLLFLSIVAIYLVPEYPLLYVASLLGCLGDLLIIFEKRKIFFYLGGISFFVGHILYLLLMLDLSDVTYNWYHYLIIIISLVGLFFVLFAITKNQLGLIEKIAASFYFGILILLLVNAAFITFKYNEPRTSLILVGYILFIISDIILVIKDFIKEFKRDDFYVMSTYIFAEISIVIGFLITILK